ncbi:hypothetical protein C8N32_10272 [Rhodovulum imhoffii]|uniref:Galactosyltransferase Lgt5 n=1 Tax=Rhodovulum imhoffii TaxID=365340 RepID=A0A2T5BVE5_9RHOB|nr:hypothetical protein [Rhodovulum imhoffii]MBK5934202.1 hypothetical protein [Rhodovulum imhoffii]PTN03551.1 hypothetical protein C8N32_10272 [Rhodovulum imhoffii]
MTLPVIGGLWVGPRLSWVEQLCLRSFVDRGHRVVLHVPAPVGGVPEGVETRPAAEICAPPFDISDGDRHRVALYSDIFRLHLFRQTAFIWADLDAYCVRPLAFVSPHVFGVSHRGTYPTGVMRLPAESPTLAAMLAFVSAPNPVQPWRGGRAHRLARRRIAQGESWGIEALPWGCAGPKAFAHFLRQTGEAHHALPPAAFYPLRIEELHKLHTPGLPPEAFEGAGVYSVHIYGHQRRHIARVLGGMPAPGSYLEALCHRHRIDPGAAPLLAEGWMAR